MRHSVEAGDRELIQIVDAALAEAARRAGSWLVCRPGCTECCMGPFPITQLDVLRLRRGLSEMRASDPERAERVRYRAKQAAERVPDENDDEPCPALDPETGTCDLYQWRPITCRAFGPPVRCGPDAVGVCELCFHGATDEQIAACEVELDPEGLEAALVRSVGAETGTVAAALL